MRIFDPSRSAIIKRNQVKLQKNGYAAAKTKQVENKTNFVHGYSYMTELTRD